jgi:tRNA threonylcarbamoyladenosine biosynthesis protein TsaE
MGKEEKINKKKEGGTEPETLELVTRSPEETLALGRQLGELASPGDVLLLSGSLGAGKTCLTQGIARGLGIAGCTPSPTFVLVRQSAGRLPLYHIDLYRLDDIEEITGLGLDDYLYGSGVCVIEWAEKGISLLPPEHLWIDIAYAGESRRHFTFKPRGRRYCQLLAGIGKI